MQAVVDAETNQHHLSGTQWEVSGWHKAYACEHFTTRVTRVALRAHTSVIASIAPRDRSVITNPAATHPRMPAIVIPANTATRTLRVNACNAQINKKVSGYNHYADRKSRGLCRGSHHGDEDSAGHGQDARESGETSTWHTVNHSARNHPSRHYGTRETYSVPRTNSSSTAMRTHASELWNPLLNVAGFCSRAAHARE